MIISTIIIRLTAYTKAKTDTAESYEAVLKTIRADFVENI
jgi:hypothetical protein